MSLKEAFSDGDHLFVPRLPPTRFIAADEQDSYSSRVEGKEDPDVASRRAQLFQPAKSGMGECINKWTPERWSVFLQDFEGCHDSLPLPPLKAPIPCSELLGRLDFPAHKAIITLKIYNASIVRALSDGGTPLPDPGGHGEGLSTSLT